MQHERHIHALTSIALDVRRARRCLHPLHAVPFLVRWPSVDAHPIRSPHTPSCLPLRHRLGTARFVSANTFTQALLQGAGLHAVQQHGGHEHKLLAGHCRHSHKLALRFLRQLLSAGGRLQVRAPVFTGPDAEIVRQSPGSRNQRPREYQPPPRRGARLHTFSARGDCAIHGVHPGTWRHAVHPRETLALRALADNVVFNELLVLNTCHVTCNGQTLHIKYQIYNLSSSKV